MYRMSRADIDTAAMFTARALKPLIQDICYCQLYWRLWYHGLLLSALLFRVLYSLIRRKLHPYPSLDELRAHRTRIDRSHTFGAMLSARLAATPSLGVEDMWHLFKDYKHTRKLKKAAKEAAARGDDGKADDAASMHSIAAEKPEEKPEDPLEDIKDEDLKRLGLFVLCEVADLLERIKEATDTDWLRPCPAGFTLPSNGSDGLGPLPWADAAFNRHAVTRSLAELGLEDAEHAIPLEEPPRA